MLDNIADLLLAVGLLAAVFEFPTKFALSYMVPGSAVGVLAGDLFFFAMAFQLAKKSGRPDITAMPLGLDTPSTFGMVFFVLGPAFLEAKGAMGMNEHDAAIFTWHIGICSIFVSGLFKLGCAAVSNAVRNIVPRAGLLGSLAAVALVLISFLPLLEILKTPLVGFLSLSIVLATLVARVKLPFRIPGALGALLVGSVVFYTMRASGFLEHTGGALIDPHDALLPAGWLTAFRFEWTAALGHSLKYLPIVLPFALGTVVGGIDCTESAAAAGDEYDTNRVVGVEAIATLIAALCGGVIQTTPYIGHPAYKAMGGRAAYTLATALFVGGAGVFGYFGYLYLLIPKAAVFPVLVFVGLEISAQSFRATPKKHYTAVALACAPALAALVLIFVDKIFGDPALFRKGVSIASLAGDELKSELLTIRVLANGFIVTSLIWASALAALIDRRLLLAAAYFLAAACASLFGVIHSPLPGSPVFWPFPAPATWAGGLPESVAHIPWSYASAYLATAVLLAAWAAWRAATDQQIADQ